MVDELPFGGWIDARQITDGLHELADIVLTTAHLGVVPDFLAAPITDRCKIQEDVCLNTRTELYRKYAFRVKQKTNIVPPSGI